MPNCLSKCPISGNDTCIINPYLNRLTKEWEQFTNDSEDGSDVPIPSFSQHPKHNKIDFATPTTVIPPTPTPIYGPSKRLPIGPSKISARQGVHRSTAEVRYTTSQHNGYPPAPLFQVNNHNERVLPTSQSQFVANVNANANNTNALNRLPMHIGSTPFLGPRIITPIESERVHQSGNFCCQCYCPVKND